MFKAPTVVQMVLAILFVSCVKKHPPAEEKPHLQISSPVRKTTEILREYVAQIRSYQHIEVRALERGYLQGIFVDEGQSVARGQKLFQIMPRLAQAEVLKSQAEADRSEIELKNTQMLADKKVVSPNELAISKANNARAQAQLSLAAAHKGLTLIIAPFDGIVGLFRARLGSLISEGDLLTTLSDNSKMWVYFNVAESEYIRIKKDLPGNSKIPVRLILANSQLFDQPGEVETIEADFNNDTGTIAFRATFNNPNGLLRHGQTGKIQISTTIPNALIIPQKATFDVLDKKFVYVIDDKNTVRTRPITVEHELPMVFVIGSGLEETDRVLIDGLRKVKDGDVIVPDFKPAAEVLAKLDVSAE